MRVMGFPLILFGLILIFIQTIHIEAGGRKAGCEAGVGGAIAAAAAGCAIIGPVAAAVCGIGAAIANTFATKACDKVPDKRSSQNRKCFYSEKLRRSVCVTPKLLYRLGKAASEPCNAGTHGKQKCVGKEGFITCVHNQWTVKQLCGAGTRCQTHPTSNRHVLCGW